MFKSLALSLALVLAAAAAPTLAAADPTPSQVYEAARSGHLHEAQQMINQVLRDHPQSGEAHYVAAQVNARMGNAAVARQELAEARRLEPGLPFASQSSVQTLERQLGVAGNSMGSRNGLVTREAPARHFPWGWLLLLFGGLALLWHFLRRRQQQTVYGNYPGGYPGGYRNSNVTGPGGPGVMPPGGVMPGTGSGMLGGLATGLAAGAGLAAGEEVIHRMTGDHNEGAVPNAGADEPGNANMGGNDFGLNEGGSSWDDGGGGGDVGGGGGDDWT
jgi:uncharacterized protein